MANVQIINNSINQEWYQSMIEDLSAMKVEKEFESRWSVIEFYHELGSRILNERQNFEAVGAGSEMATKHVALSLGMSLRSVQLSVQFVNMFPHLDELPDGKAVSWHKIVKTYLPQKKDVPSLPELPAVNELQDKIVKYSLLLAQTAKITKDGIVLLLTIDME